ncbi:DUF2878 domain-containing protein [Vibrio hannami]|uniref:DUF2878 domain-containing protein n=1 Tax=Vibrio hannami TaxID=2717094 RepID=UPI00240FA38C|nr:DUF2878 domain-containing protein [Vibrio hannami]MDG3087673.1 DUF2878 domain-containing protein [Vibrio hannami]
MALFLKSLWFQMIWFLAVLGRGDYLILLVILIVSTYLYSLYKKDLPITFAISVVGLGLLVDGGNIYNSILNFDTGPFPLWLICLWLIFAWYCWQIRAFLIRLPLVGVLFLGGTGGALSYLAGYKLSAVALAFPVYVTFAILFVEWILLTWSVRLLIRNRWE